MSECQQKCGPEKESLTMSQETAATHGWIRQTLQALDNNIARISDHRNSANSCRYGQRLHLIGSRVGEYASQDYQIDVLNGKESSRFSRNLDILLDKEWLGYKALHGCRRSTPRSGERSKLSTCNSERSVPEQRQPYMPV